MSSANSGAVAHKRRSSNAGACVVGSSVIYLAAVSLANAQTSDNGQANDTSVGEIVVSATRIKASGFSAPTPTTVIGAEAIQQAAQPNLRTNAATFS